MTKKQILAQLCILEKAYGKNITSEWADMVIERFKDCKKEDFAKAIEHIIETREAFPAIATLYIALQAIGGSPMGEKYPIEERLIWPNETELAEYNQRNCRRIKRLIKKVVGKTSIISL